MANMGHCSQCGKDFPMLYPHLWRYKTGNKLFCSWHCLRADERKEEDEMARLKKDGTPWGKSGPKTAAKVEKVPKVPAVEIPEQQIHPLGLQGGVNYQLKVDEAAKQETEQPNAIQRLAAAMSSIKVPEIAPEFELEITAVRHKNYGEFYRDHDHNCIDWRTPCGDEMSLGVEAWKKLIRDLPEILKQLGVEV